MICRRTMQECQTPGMCAPYGGCGNEASNQLLATWAALMISTGQELGISKDRMLKTLTPTKLAAMYDVMASDE